MQICRWFSPRIRPRAMRFELEVLFACLIIRTFSANEQCFSLTTNQPTLLSAMAYQPSEWDPVLFFWYSDSHLRRTTQWACTSWAKHDQSPSSKIRATLTAKFGKKIKLWHVEIVLKNVWHIIVMTVNHTIT
jgi:hypothetical protein